MRVGGARRSPPGRRRSLPRDPVVVGTGPTGSTSRTKLISCGSFRASALARFYYYYLFFYIYREQNRVTRVSGQSRRRRRRRSRHTEERNDISVSSGDCFFFFFCISRHFSHNTAFSPVKRMSLWGSSSRTVPRPRHSTYRHTGNERLIRYRQRFSPR